MADFRILISDPKTGKTFQRVLKPEEIQQILGKKIGEHFRGEGIGLSGYELQITGGSDKDGFPMRPEVEGSIKKRLLLAEGPGFNPTRKGLRKRKMIRGKIVSPETAQLNTKVVKHGSQDLAKLFGKEEAPAKEEQKQE